MKRLPYRIVLRLMLAVGLAAPCAGTSASEFKTPDNPPEGYDHDKWRTTPRELIHAFGAFMSSFDGPDDDDGDGQADYLGVPHWVSYELRAFEGELPTSPARPSPWITIDVADDPSDDPIYPGDDSYKNSGYHRGHLCMKNHAWRLGANADWNTHTVVNAVPQESEMNTGVWLRLENKTAEWADTWGAVWIIDGPVFLRGEQKRFIGDEGEEKVAVPDALFKIVVAETEEIDWPDVLAFLIPQHGMGDFADSANADLRPYLTSVDIIEALTGLDFFTTIDDEAEVEIERVVYTDLDAWDE